MKGHRLKDDYDKKLWEICKAQADLVRERIARAAFKRQCIEREIQMERESRSNQNAELREKGVIVATTRRQRLLEDKREKKRGRQLGLHRGSIVD